MPPSPPIASTLHPVTSSHRSGQWAFSLVELLVVIAIAAILTGLSISALTRNHTADVTTAAYQIANALELARSYAVANHTYTWVGFFEENPSKSTSNKAVSGIGRVVISIVASRDGTSIFNEAAAETTGTATPQVTALEPTRLVQIAKLTKLDSIHICTPKAVTATFAKRPGAFIDDKDRIGLSPSSSPLLFTFPYPLSNTAKYTFGIRPAPTVNGENAPSGIVMFNPEGEAISDAGPIPGVAPTKEIAIQATRGTNPIQPENVAAIDLNGLTGLATIYRP